MKRILLILILFSIWLCLPAQQRRPIDNTHPMWIIHIDVWNAADPQKIIDLIPEEIKPYVCMNLSFSCQYDVASNMYKMPRSAVRTYKSWASICQQNGVWFTCQQASGGHAHIQDDDLETFEYFFKKYPNFLGWNYAEQFWGFDEVGDKSSSTQESRIALFAKLVEMSHKYGGFLTVSFCGNIWSHPLNPLGMMKRNPDLLKACRDYPEAILWLYKYTTSSCFYNNESVTWGPFVAGLANNYGVRYDNCGWNGALNTLLGDNHGKPYPGSAGIGTVMEQMCVNGGAVWDGPELTTTEDFRNLNATLDDGFLRRNWGTFPNFDGIWLDMFG
ncbi:MAG: glycosyl hydrolase family 98, partial [Muribaculaceae bacterium]|nr:glycosyl hydrolase family 98 [Muribaculaceae bacterium]